MLTQQNVRNYVGQLFFWVWLPAFSCAGVLTTISAYYYLNGGPQGIIAAIVIMIVIGMHGLFLYFIHFQKGSGESSVSFASAITGGTFFVASYLLLALISTQVMPSQKCDRYNHYCAGSYEDHSEIKNNPLKMGVVEFLVGPHGDIDGMSRRFDAVFFYLVILILLTAVYFGPIWFMQLISVGPPPPAPPAPKATPQPLSSKPESQAEESIEEFFNEVSAPVSAEQIAEMTPADIRSRVPRTDAFYQKYCRFMNNVKRKDPVDHDSFFRIAKRLKLYRKYKQGSHAYIGERVWKGAQVHA